MLTKQNNQNKQNLLPVTALLGGAIIWGLLWYPYRVLEQAEISGSIATAITYFIALVLGLVAFRKDLRMSHIAGGEPYLLLGIALFAGWTNLAYVLGVIHGEVMRVLLLFYLAPLWTVVFSRLLLKERLSRHGYLVIVISLAGAVTMLWEPESGSLLPSTYGDWMGLSAGFMFALLNVLSRKDQYHNVQSKSVAVWMGVALTGYIYSLFLPDLVLSSISMNSYLLLLGLGIIVFVLSVIVQYGVTHVPANRAIVIMLFELVVAAVAAYFLTDEAMTPKSWMGGALIVSASLFSARMNRE
ncbi:DMT family transporter [Nitrosospira sp. NpAV]|uniref:DMT family transporter n=1 Tax=Nitrosospira sp. NpAV TaxID=58133 RepID=UPI0005A298EC|nr:DMT family transporter [Nitrosospira sp. NpAV]KIO47886.1 permease of the drug/metabolite transporter (DMT) superfamily [Nitrosospira sp. NpAV]